MIARAEVLARPAFAHHCASCHGARMQGEPAKGAVNLSDDIWLYGSGRVTDIERTILYGIRSGDGKARNITDMPAMGRSQQISAADTRDVEAYILSLTRPQPDQASVARGSIIYQRKGNCYDCHSADAKGNPDYGTPAFTDTDWIWGGDPGDHLQVDLRRPPRNLPSLDPQAATGGNPGPGHLSARNLREGAGRREQGAWLISMTPSTTGWASACRC